MEKITDFLNTRTSTQDLAVALAVLREFKQCESNEEWYTIPFVAWAKFEQFQEFLEHLVEGTMLKDDTLRYMWQED